MAQISDYGFISDCRSGALVDRAGGIDWLCFPRFDSPSVFARLVDPSGGHWSIAPTEPCRFTRSYEPDSLVLATRFECDSGVVELRDALAFGEGERGHEIGLSSPHVLLRLVRCIEGRVRVASECRPRPEYGLALPKLADIGDGSVSAVSGAVSMRLSADTPLEIDDEAAAVLARFEIAEDESIAFALSYGRTFGDPPAEVLDPAARLHETEGAWRSWAKLHWGEGLGYRGPYQDQVRRSALVLQGLTYQRSGSVVAALTTSLPEREGGEWNWDYRYSWLRDASLMMRALWVAACPDEPEAFFHWIDVATGKTDGSSVQIVYGIEGERDLSERVLAHLEGFGGAKPVRAGNDAWKQKQLDVLGEVIDAAHQLDATVEEWSGHTKALLTGFADHAAEHWREPDAGMWEARDRERHYTSSKVMCWVAVDRALDMADRIGASEGQRARWQYQREAVRETVLQEAWSPRRQAYSGAFGSDHLDASVLLMPLVGFLPADDERMRSTIEAVDRELGDDGLIRRWADEPNAFLLTSFWMVRCQALLGNLEEAKRRFERILTFANDLGLLAEEADPASGRPLGNVPQAFSHVGLINAAWEIAECERSVVGTNE